MIQETECTLKTRHKILIIGGYGQVGRLIAERLAKLFPNRVVIAGRNWQKASSIAASIGFGVKPRSVDILSTDWGNVLNEVALVVSCLNQTNSRFVEQCLFESIHYIDISANDKFLAQIEQLDDCAKRHNATVMLSVGVAPGLSNMLAVQLLKQMKHIARLDIVLEFGLGDQHGKAACEWMFDNFNATYSVQEHDQPKAVKSFGECLNISLWANDLARSAFRFNFPDQHTIRRIYRIQSVSTWLRFDTRVMTWLFTVLSRIGLSTLLRYNMIRSIAVWLVMHVRIGSDACIVAVRAQDSTMSPTKTQTLSIIGRKEALMTAIITVEAASQILSKAHAPGVFHSFQILSLNSILSALKKEFSDLIINL